MPDSLFVRPDFLSSSNIYEVNTRQYTPEGTFRAFSEHIPRLKKMGVEILWLMPIHPIGKEKRKGTLGSYYSIADHKGINPEFGDENDLRELITKIHANGMKVILDWVANHTAWDHVWTKSNPGFFVKDANGNFVPPYDWDDVIRIDHSNKDEQAAMIDAMEYWIRVFDVDGFRADLAHLTPLPFWKDARLKLSPLKKDLVWLAETEDHSYLQAFDICFTWKWMHATEQFSKKEISLTDCIEILKQSCNDLPANALQLFFTSNHDENSWNGTEYEKYDENAKALAVFSCLYPGIPLVYSGQEWPNLKRLKFFEKDELKMNGEPVLENFYRVLFELRMRNATVFSQIPAGIDFQKAGLDKGILAYRLTENTSEVIVFLNLSGGTVSQEFNFENCTGKFRDIFSGESFELSGPYIFNAAPGNFTVLEKQ